MNQLIFVDFSWQEKFSHVLIVVIDLVTQIVEDFSTHLHTSKTADLVKYVTLLYRHICMFKPFKTSDS
jgi:hypothetical protein